MRLVTTHDWSSPADATHVADVRRDVTRLGEGGATHLVLEVVAYAVDEAVEGDTTAIGVVLHGDGSVEVVDDGRGTDTRRDDDGTWRVKPVMATRDLRFFDVPAGPRLDDGLPRRGMSVVTALSSWLVHRNERVDGAWSARYEAGLPAGAPGAAATTGRTGTSVRFLPDPSLVAALDEDALRALLARLDVPATVTISAG